MNIKTRILTITAAGAIVLAGVAGATGLASAQEPTPTPNARQAQRQAVRDGFLNHLASNLNVTLDQLNGAIKNAELQTVDDLTADGTIRADQATKIKDRINSGRGLGLGAFFRTHARRVELLTAVRRGIAKSAADAIGIAPKDLASELKSGKSIADVASEHNVSLDTVKSKIMDNAKTALDKARENGRIDQAKEDAALQKLRDNLDTILNRTRGQAQPPAQ
jgi:hypothetical protein